MQLILSFTIRTIWFGMGLANIAIGVIGTDEILSKILTILCGLLTVIMSILLGGFIKHLAGHSSDSDRLFKVLDGYVQKELCTERVERIEEKIDGLKETIEAGFPKIQG